MKNHRLYYLIVIVFWIGCTKKIGKISASITTQSPTPPQNENYFPKVRSIVKANCTISCHATSPGFNQGLPVVLETDTDIVLQAFNIKEAVSGPVSPINKRMPDGGELSNEDISIIIAWCNKGGRERD